MLLSSLPLDTLQLGDDELFIYLINNSEAPILREFGRFLHNSFIKRRPPDIGIVSNSLND